MKKTAAIIFSNINDQQLPELTKLRTVAAVPIAARYRLIDFPLSGLSNAGVHTIGIVCKAKYHSLMRHVGGGKSWDLDRKTGGVTVISPYVEAGSGPLYVNRLEALQNSLRYVMNINAENIILTDADHLANIPYKDILEAHADSGADITAVYKKVNIKTPVSQYNLDFDVADDGSIEKIKIHDTFSGKLNHGLNLYVIKRQVFVNMINDSLIYGYKSFSRELLPLYLKRSKVMAYEFTGYVSYIVTLQDFWQGNMDLLDSHIRNEIFNQKDLPIYTNPRDSNPTIYEDDCNVSNSLISDGCVIAGTVENSVIFRGVRVDEGAVVRNSVLLTDTIIESGARLDHVVADRTVVVRKGRTLSGCDGYPFFIPTMSIL